MQAVRIQSDLLCPPETDAFKARQPYQCIYQGFDNRETLTGALKEQLPVSLETQSTKKAADRCMDIAKF